MSDDPTSRLLGEDESQDVSRTSKPSNSPSKPAQSDESTPLLSREAPEPYHDDTEEEDEADLERPTSHDGTKHKRSQWRWPSIIALAVLSLLIIAILCLGFAVPAAMEEYVKEAAVFEPTNLSIDSFTAEGVKARIRGDFFLDGDRVGKKSVRDLGRAGTWIAKAVETSETFVEVYLPEYGNIALGTANIPPITVSIRDGEINHVDLIAHIKPANTEGLRQIASDWVEGRLGQLVIQGKADVRIKSGMFSFGTQTIMQSLTFEGHDVPALPKYNITRLNVHELQLPDESRAVSADVSISAYNKHPLSFTVPPLAFDILVPGCSPDSPYILLANATTKEIHIESKQMVRVDAQGVIRQLSEPLLAICPGSLISPLDTLLHQYIHGDKAVIFVKGADAPSTDTPGWITDILSSLIVSVPFSGRSMDKLIRKFSLDDVHFGMPDSTADPDTPEAQPKISAIVEVLANLPNEMNIPVNVSRVRSKADIFYEGDKFGILDIKEWQEAASKRIEAHDDLPAAMQVEAAIENAPINITDADVFGKVLGSMFFGIGNTTLDVQASVDIEIATVLGKFVIRDIPAEGTVPLKPLPINDGVHALAPKIWGLEIVETGESTILLEAKANFTNPTNYSATVPYVSINILSNGTVLGQATATNISCVPGKNEDVHFRALWDPVGHSGAGGASEARSFLSKYVSGRSLLLMQKEYQSLMIRLQYHSHLEDAQEDIPSCSTSWIRIVYVSDRHSHPKAYNAEESQQTDNGDDDDKSPGKPHFIDDATMHLLSSTATFTLLSPLQHTTLFITHINATAYYNHTDPVGIIIYDLPLAVHPGATTTPPLPVDWSLDGVGYDAVKEALGGTLTLSTKADVGIKVGDWAETIWFEGDGIGAHIRI